MRRSWIVNIIVVLVLVSLIAILQIDRISWHASGKNGALVAGDKEAVKVGLEIFEKGGNAIDVAAATI